MGGFTGLQTYLSLSFILLTFFPTISISVDTLSATQSLGTNQTLVSSKEVFELGFFSSSSSGSTWYLGIWYKKIPDRTVVWVANRNTPLENSNGTLKIGDRGNMVLLDQSGKSIWSSNQTAATNPVLQLLDSGNLILREANENDPTKFLWQSFDYPTDTLLQGMKLGWNLDTGMEWYITSWKSEEDPSSGDFSFRLDYHGLPEIFLLDKQVRQYRTGPWNGLSFSGLAIVPADSFIRDSLTANAHQVYYTASTGSQSLLSRLTVNWTGEIQRLAWMESSQVWSKIWYAPSDQCDSYVECGPYGICDANAYPVCKCLKGFKPQNQQAWGFRDFSEGCVRSTELDCAKDKFLHMQNMELPDTAKVFVNRNMTLIECQNMCLQNCSCTAYANMEITSGGTGCVMWTDKLIDLRQFSVGGQDIFVRVPASVIDSIANDGKRRKIILIIAVSAAVLLLCFIFYLAKRNKVWKTTTEIIAGNGNQNEGQALPLFNIDTILAATDNFSGKNKIGEGGFGPVYKGKLAQGQEIAVKRLSKNSKQGVQEFMNEVELVAKLQHRNLVRVLGGCTKGEERMLVYEYMPNRSLDHFIFDPRQGKLLNWRKRYDIIMGIARGLLYLHQDSRLTIIHRDLKTSNILLDSELNPKISDFGMAHIFEGDDSTVKTKRIVGTYGYMSPEYARNGLFSVNSDVFGFGVIVLEILSGIKNTNFNLPDNRHNLLGQAWILWKEGRPREFMDGKLDLAAIPSDILRCLQVGLLCVQKFPNDRPTMLSVVFMLGNESMTLPHPKEPGFFNEEFHDSSEDGCCSNNSMTITLLEARN